MKLILKSSYNFLLFPTLQRYSFLMAQLNTEYPIEDKTFREWRKIDVQDHSVLEKELAEMWERHVVSGGLQAG
jgi:hypothetical protein